MIDFHCHLDLYPYPAVAVEDADDAQIFVLFVTTTPKAWPSAKAMVGGRRRIRVALGLHPELAPFREVWKADKVLWRDRFGWITAV